MSQSTPARPVPDFRVENHGTIYLLFPDTDAAREWCDEHLPSDRQTWGTAIVVGHRYISDIVDGARNHGLTVE